MYDNLLLLLLLLKDLPPLLIFREDGARFRLTVCRRNHFWKEVYYQRLLNKNSNSL